MPEMEPDLKKNHQNKFPVTAQQELRDLSIVSPN